MKENNKKTKKTQTNILTLFLSEKEKKYLKKNQKPKWPTNIVLLKKTYLG